MDNLKTIIFSGLAMTMILSACDNEISKEQQSVTDDSKKTSETKKLQVKGVKDPAEPFDISSKAFMEEYANEKGLGFRGIEPGMTFGEVKRKLGEPDSYSSEDILDFGGFCAYYKNFIITFEKVGRQSDVHNSSKVKDVFLRNDDALPLEDFQSEWGEYEKFIPFGSDSIGTNVYNINNRSIDAFVDHDDIKLISKVNLKKIYDAQIISMKNRDFGKQSEDISFINGIAHYITPPYTDDVFRDYVKTNQVEILGKQPGDSGAATLIEKLGEPKDDYDLYDDHIYEYDNFRIAVTDDDEISYFEFINYARQPGFEPYKDWNLESNIAMGDSIVIDDNDSDNFYFEFPYEPKEGVPDNYQMHLRIWGKDSDYQPVDTSESDEDEVDYTSEAFGYKILSNSFNYKGLYAGDDYSPDEILEITGEPDTNALGHYVYDQDGISIDSYGGIVHAIGIDLSDHNIPINDLRKGWDQPYIVEQGTHGTETIYDNDTSNGYYVIVRSNGGFVEDIVIMGVNRGEE